MIDEFIEFRIRSCSKNVMKYIMNFFFPKVNTDKKKKGEKWRKIKEKKRRIWDFRIHRIATLWNIFNSRNQVSRKSASQSSQVYSRQSAKFWKRISQIDHSLLIYIYISFALDLPTYHNVTHIYSRHGRGETSERRENDNDDAKEKSRRF